MIDYSLYLVTDSTQAILKERDIVAVVRDAVQGGATIVQYRDKTSETSELVHVAKQLHQITRQHGIPLIINDRLDVALAVGAEGVHIGQDDMDLPSARRIMGNEAIIGVTASSVEEALTAARGGANYLGLGTVYSTATKQDVKSIIGTSGVRAILESLSSNGHAVLPTVCIGSINGSNAKRVMRQSACSSKRLDGVAVVSAIMGADDPKQASLDLVHLVKSVSARSDEMRITEPVELVAQVPSVLLRLTEKKPLNHNMTNLVVQNFAANVALATGSSPIMSNNGHEAADLASLGGSLLINMGTMGPDSMEAYLTALKAYNSSNRPVVFDPVGAGATQVRRDALKTIMIEGYFDLIKGNESEIQAVLGTSNLAQHGVDSSTTLSSNEKARVVKGLATREQNVVLMTGEIDYLSDGTRTYSISNGHSYLGEVTGSGCALGTVIASCLAVEPADNLLAALSGILLYEIAAERAAASPEAQGPGTFIPKFIDELYNLRTKLHDVSWLRSAKVQAV